MSLIFNKHSELGKRRTLRKRMPTAEVILWARLKGKQLGGLKFRRQYGIGRFVVDFYCPAKKLIVEIDGPSHFTPDVIGYDKERQGSMEALGLRVVRVQNTDVYENIDGVLEYILQAAE